MEMDRSSNGRRLKCMIGSLCVILIAFSCVDKKNRYGIEFNDQRSIIQLPLLDSSWEYSPSYTENVARSAILAHLNQMCWDFERRMRCKALRVRALGAYSRTWPSPNSESNAADRLRAKSKRGYIQLDIAPFPLNSFPRNRKRVSHDTLNLKPII